MILDTLDFLINEYLPCFAKELCKAYGKHLEERDGMKAYEIPEFWKKKLTHNMYNSGSYIYFDGKLWRGSWDLGPVSRYDVVDLFGLSGWRVFEPQPKPKTYVRMIWSPLGNFSEKTPLTSWIEFNPTDPNGAEVRIEFKTVTATE